MLLSAAYEPSRVLLKKTNEGKTWGATVRLLNFKVELLNQEIILGGVAMEITLSP